MRWACFLGLWIVLLGFAPVFALTGAKNGKIASLISQSTSDPADTGVVRLGNAESVCWEHNTSGTDQCLLVDSNNILEFNGGLQLDGDASLAGNTGSTGNLYGSRSAGWGLILRANTVDSAQANIALGGGTGSGVNIMASSTGYIDFARDSGGVGITRWIDGATAFVVSVQVPTPLAASYALTWPGAVPTVSGSPLVADAVGTLSWSGAQRAGATAFIQANFGGL